MIFLNKKWWFENRFFTIDIDQPTPNGCHDYKFLWGIERFFCWVHSSIQMRGKMYISYFFQNYGGQGEKQVSFNSTSFWFFWIKNDDLRTDSLRLTSINLPPTGVMIINSSEALKDFFAEFIQAFKWGEKCTFLIFFRTTAVRVKNKWVLFNLILIFQPTPNGCHDYKNSPEALKDFF